MHNFTKQINNTIKFLAILHIAIICLPPIFQIIAITDYYIHQDYYAEVLCVNKNKPALSCNGKCQIKDYLRQEEKGNEQPSVPPSIFKVLKVEAIFHTSSTFFFIPTDFGSRITPYASKLPKSNFINEIFVPPKQW